MPTTPTKKPAMPKKTDSAKSVDSTKNAATPKAAATPRKPRVVKDAPAKDAVHKAPKAPKTDAPAVVAETSPIAETVKAQEKPVYAGAELNVGAAGRYVYAVGRRKTSVANIRLFSGKGKSTINNKD